MKPVRLAFSRRLVPSQWLLGHAPRTRIGPALCLGAALAAAAAVAWEIWDTRQQIRNLHQASAALSMQRGHAARQSTPTDKPLLTLQQSREWNQLIRQLNIPWPTLLDALEDATPETIALVTIEPNPNQGSVRLQAEAKTLDTVLAYAQTLKTAGLFVDVVLLKHETNEQDASRPVRLSLDLRLKRKADAPDSEIAR
jgi:hypothetical protein